jgi:hypothetical protein
MAATARKKPAAKKKEPEAPELTDEDYLCEMVVGGVECRMDVRLTKLTFGEAEVFEDIFGKSIDRLTVGDVQSAKGTLAFGYLARRKVDPDFTLDDARALSREEIEVKEARPTETPDDAGSQS